jgi:adenosylhomocysteinase
MNLFIRLRMPYLLENTQLRTVRWLVRLAENDALRRARLIILEHILPTTVEYISHLKSVDVDIFALLAKPYSIDDAAAKLLESSGTKPILITYDQLETSTFLDDLLNEAIHASKNDTRPILILDVGGYFAEPLKRLSPEAPQYISGIVEDTTFGHNRYLKAVGDIPIPVFSVAKSALKEIEARFVGRDAVAAAESVLRGLGVSIAGRNALVIGYGMIGSNVARALRNQDVIVQVYDKEDFKNLSAFIDGFHINAKRKLLEHADIIFAATADRALVFREIEECKDNVILASVGSKNTEFDMHKLEEQALSRTPIGRHVAKYCLANGHTVMVIKEGTAVNFLLPSLPVEILDLVFSEILVCMTTLLTRPADYPAGQKVYEVGSADLSDISKKWLRFVNN